jgi:hypothetical protein
VEVPLERVRRRQVSRAVGTGAAFWLIGNGSGLVLVEVVGLRPYRPVETAAVVAAVSTLVAVGVVLRWHARTEGRGLPVPLAVFVVLLLCGAGGAAGTYGVQRGVREARLYLDPASVRGTQRLPEPRSMTEGPLTLTVTGVEVNSRFTIVRMEATNSSDEMLRLPVADFAHLALPDGTTFAGDPRTSRWPEALPARGFIRGYVVFVGVIAPGAALATVGFTQVFSTRGPRSIGVPLRLADLTVR